MANAFVKGGKSWNQSFPGKPEIDDKRPRRARHATYFRQPIARVETIGPMGEPRGLRPVGGAFTTGPRALMPASGFGAI